MIQCRIIIFPRRLLLNFLLKLECLKNGSKNNLVGQQIIQILQQSLVSAYSRISTYRMHFFTESPTHQVRPSDPIDKCRCTRNSSIPPERGTTYSNLYQSQTEAGNKSVPSIEIIQTYSTIQTAGYLTLLGL